MLDVTVDNLLLVTCEKNGFTECRIARWIWKFVPFILTVFGVVGNILNITVLLRKKLRKKSACVFLLFLAISDITFLCSGPLVQTARFFYGCKLYTHLPSLCNIPRWLAHSSGLISCWLIVFITIEKSLLIVFPVTSKRIFTPRNAVFASMGLLVFATSYSGHLLYGYVVTTKGNNANTLNGTNLFCPSSCTLRPGKYTDFLNSTWNILIMSAASIVPIFLIVTGNAIVGRFLIKHKRKMRRVPDGEGNAVSRRRNVSRSALKGFSTKLLFILSGVYIVTTVPYGIFILKLKQNQLVDDHTFAKYQLANVLVRCAMWSNFSMNFLLYFMTGNLFKAEFKKITRKIGVYLRLRTTNR